MLICVYNNNIVVCSSTRGGHYNSLISIKQHMTKEIATNLQTISKGESKWQYNLFRYQNAEVRSMEPETNAIGSIHGAIGTGTFVQTTTYISVCTHIIW